MTTNSLIHSFKQVVRPSVLFASLAALSLGLLLCILSQVASTLYAQHIASADTLVIPQIGHHVIATTSSQNSITASAPVATNITPVAIPTCVPIAAASPAPLNVSTADGLVQQVDAPSSYQIYGNDSSTIRSQIQRCAPKTAGSNDVEFVAETSYQLTWQYKYVETGGLCRVSQAAVGVHVTQTVPTWQPTSAANAGLPAAWNTYMGNLMTHENGHKALDIQYAQQLLNDLRNYPARPCDQMLESVKQLIDQDVAELAQANDNYDATTNHGATQGAILPQ